MELFGMLNALQPLSTALTDHLYSVLKERQFSKKEFLLREGQISSNVYFVLEGAIRAYYINPKGEEITNWFMKEGDVIFSVESFLERIPSYEYIVALEDCTTYYISYAELQSIYNKFPEFNFHGRVLTEKYYKQSLQREYLIKKKTSLERYQLLLENEPHLLAMASLQDIATYLGMTPEVL
ncbi:MAG: Crp/Fnr family transcriptional regulator, partial [Chitinophaga rupis]